MAKTDEERKAERSRRMMEKSMRMPLNNIILEVQKGTIDINDLFKRIETKVKEVRSNG